MANAYDLAALVGRGRARAYNQIANAKRPRIADYRLPFRTRRMILLFSHYSQR
ncbi:MAG: hypothetical protein ACREA2_24500 [Blastocatellia bacterium]